MQGGGENFAIPNQNNEMFKSKFGDISETDLKLLGTEQNS